MATLPQARVLWTESDPHEDDGEMWLMKRPEQEA